MTAAKCRLLNAYYFFTEIQPSEISVISKRTLTYTLNVEEFRRSVHVKLSILSSPFKQGLAVRRNIEVLLLQGFSFLPCRTDCQTSCTHLDVEVDA